jgi:hypothetical protein
VKAAHLGRALMFVALAGAAACDDDDDPVTPTGTLTLAVSSTALTLAQGRTDSVDVTITRGGSFTGPVILTASGAPTGATVTFGGTTLAAGQTTTKATITLVANTAPGVYPITITAAGTGVTTSTATLTLTVIAAQAADFTLVAAPDTFRVAQGGSATGFVRLTRTGGFDNAVTLTAGTLPAGVTVTFGAANLTGDSTSVEVSGTATATLGIAPLEIIGTSGTTVRRDTVGIVVRTP